MIYLDNSATTALDAAVLEAMMPWLGTVPANASSVHLSGRRARVAVEAARTEIAALIGAHPAELLFTSGGTESNNTVLKSMAIESGLVTSVAVGATEHHAVLHPAEWLFTRGVSMRVLPVDADGRVDPGTLAASNQPNTLVSVMAVNNETGIVNDLPAIRTAVPEAYLHTDAVQALGKIPVNVQNLGVDFMTLSAHKVHGPVGVGALFIRKGIDFKEHQHGGAQERNRRAGTEPVAAIVGFQTAVRLAVQHLEQRAEHMRSLTSVIRNYLVDAIPHVRVNTPVHGAAPHIMNVSFPEPHSVDGEALIQMLDMQGVAASNGSACVSGSQQPSHVLKAMGLGTAEASAAVRLSVAHTSTLHDVMEACAIVVDVVRRLRV